MNDLIKKISPRTAVLAGCAALGLLALITVVWYFTRDTVLAEYPDAPYPPVSADYPRIIITDVAPSEQDKEAYNAYWDGRRAVRKYLREDGAMREASADEREAYRLALQESQYVSARDLVVKVLQANPDSIPGRLSLAVIEHKGEGNFTRALFLLRKLRHELHDRGLKDPADANARQWYLQVLEQEYLVLDDLNRDPEQLRVLDLIEQIYEPLPWRRTFPLVRLGRFDEARQTLETAEKTNRMVSTVAYQRMVLENELGNREASYEAAKKAVEVDPESAVAAYGLFNRCNQAFLFAEGEASLLKATRMSSVDYWGSPFTALAGVLAEKGLSAEAWDALKRAQVQRRARDAYTLIMDQAGFDGATAGVLLQLGYAGEAYRIRLRIHDRPSRTSSTATKRDVEFGKLFPLLKMLRNRQAELREIEAFGGQQAAAAAEEHRQLTIDSWAYEKRLLRMYTDQNYVIDSFRPLMPSVSQPGPLDLPMLAALLPSGVALEALRQAREREKHPAAVPYFDAVEAEMAWRAGRYSEAVEQGRRALAGISAEYERAMCARVAVVVAESLRQLGRMDEAMPLYDQALANYAAVYRLMDVAIPVSVGVDRTPLAAPWGDRLLASPRFRGNAKGFPLTLRGDGGRLSFELFRLNNVRHCQGDVPAEGLGDEVIAAGCRRLIARIMSPQLELTATDINSLDNGLFSAPASSDTEKLLKLASPR